MNESYADTLESYLIAEEGLLKKIVGIGTATVIGGLYVKSKRHQKALEDAAKKFLQKPEAKSLIEEAKNENVILLKELSSLGNELYNKIDQKYRKYFTPGEKIQFNQEFCSLQGESDNEIVKKAIAMDKAEYYLIQMDIYNKDFDSEQGSEYFQDILEYLGNTINEYAVSLCKYSKLLDKDSIKFRAIDDPVTFVYHFSPINKNSKLANAVKNYR